MLRTEGAAAAADQSDVWNRPELDDATKAALRQAVAFTIDARTDSDPAALQRAAKALRLASARLEREAAWALEHP